MVTEKEVEREEHSPILTGRGTGRGCFEPSRGDRGQANSQNGLRRLNQRGHHEPKGGGHRQAVILAPDNWDEEVGWEQWDHGEQGRMDRIKQGVKRET